MRITVSFLLLILALTAVSQDYRTLCNNGIKHIADRNYKQATECFKKATELSSSEHERTYAYANLAYSQQMCGELGKALKSYNTAIGNDTDKVALMLQRANMKNAIANSAVVRLFSNRFSAVSSIIMKLVSCSASSSLAFIVLFGLLVELPKNKVAFPVFYH